MKYVDEFRDPVRAGVLLKEIEALTAQIMAGRDRPVVIMEVCGGHTHSIFRYRIEKLEMDNSYWKLRRPELPAL